MSTYTLLSLLLLGSSLADPKDEVFISVPDVVEQYGYPLEVHFVTTSDGYILRLHRIPHGRTNRTTSNKPVLVQHGILCSSANYVTSGNGSLAFVLADAGYDVWLGNARGNNESRNHTTLDPNTDAEFWDFSWHEMGVMDLPAMIDYLTNVTQQEKIFYIGHSQGTTNLFVMASVLPEYNGRIRAHFHMAPSGYMDHTKLPFFLLAARFIRVIERVTEAIGIEEYLAFSRHNSEVLLALCGVVPRFCSAVIFFLFGYSPDEMNYERLPVILGHFPLGASRRQLLHYGQLMESGFFRQYDYNERNVEVYGTRQPPFYNLSRITAPGYFYYSTTDNVEGVPDVERTCRDMEEGCFEKYLFKNVSFNHVDWLYGKRAVELVYSRIIREMAKH